MKLSLLALAASAAFLAAACSGAPPEDTAQSFDPLTVVCGAKTNGPVQGVDVSTYQGNFDWNGAKANGVVFGYARVSDGLNYPDNQFSGNWSKMKSAGVLRGAYMFFEPGQDPTQQANLMVQKVGTLGGGDLPAMIDVETTGGQSPATIAAHVKTWLDVVEKGTGRKPLIYSGSYFWADNVQSTAFGSYGFWIAAYGVSCPMLPPGWSKWQIWQYSDGNGSLDHDVFNGTLAELQALAQPPDASPRGYLDTADCTQVAGWSQDTDTPTQAVNVDLYFGGAAGSGAPGLRTLANQSRQDLCKAIGSCEHGFSIPPPRSLLDGKAHPVFAYGIDSSPQGQNALLGAAPKSFTCEAPAIPAGTIRRWVTDPKSFADWKFDAFTEVARYADATLAAVPKGADAPAAPQLVQGDDGSPAVYVMDGKTKRHVTDPASFAAWGFDWGAIQKVPATGLAETATGPDWPPAPLLVQGDGPEVDMLDVAPPSTGTGGDGGAGGPGNPGTPGSPGTEGGNGDTAQGSGGCNAGAGGADGAGAMLVGLAMVLATRRRRAA